MNHGRRSFVARGSLLVLVCAASARQGAGAQQPPARADTTKADTTRPAQKLGPTVVVEKSEALPTAFLRRSTIKGTGRFFTASDIETFHPVHTPGLLARLTGGDVKEINGTMRVVATHRNFGANVCFIDVAINDVAVPRDYDLREIRPEQIVALEVYAGPASVPLELARPGLGTSSCGLVAIWIKERRK